MRIPQRPRRLGGALVIGLALSLAPAAAAVPASSAPATDCAVEWGSLVKKRAPYTSRQLTDVRSGQHDCYDRLVFIINGDGTGKPGYQVKYVRRVTKDGSGAVVRLRGPADLRIIVKAPASANGEPTYQPADRRELVDVTDYETFRQVAWAGTFEGQTTIGLGVRARLPMRAFVLRGAGGGHRLVVDVAHDWS